MAFVNLTIINWVVTGTVRMTVVRGLMLNFKRMRLQFTGDARHRNQCAK